MHDTGTSSIIYVRYWYYQYCNITILVFLVLYSVTILVIPVSRPTASYYPHFVLINDLTVLTHSERVSESISSLKLYFQFMNCGLRYLGPLARILQRFSLSMMFKSSVMTWNNLVISVVIRDCVCNV